MSAPHTYDPQKVVITIGSHKVTGYASDTFINISEMTSGIQSEAGADGEVGRAMSRDGRHTITLTLQQHSATNDVLSKLHQVDKLSGNGTFPVAVKDLRGTSLFASSSAWIIKTADYSAGSGLTNREWTFETSDGLFMVGGNS